MKEWSIVSLLEISRMVPSVGKTFQNLILMTSSMMLSSNIMSGIMHSLKSYIKGSDKFYGTQHSMISLGIHWFGSGTVHWSSGNYPSILFLVSEFIQFDQFILECIEYDGIIKCFVLIMQGINHIGDREWTQNVWQTVKPSSGD